MMRSLLNYSEVHDWLLLKVCSMLEIDGSNKNLAREFEHLLSG
jgi:hypothetical protein